VGGYAPGSYMGRCYICEEQIMGVDKYARSCLACALDELREAYEEVDRAFLSAKAIEARRGETARLDGDSHESAVGLPICPDTDGALIEKG